MWLIERLRQPTFLLLKMDLEKNGFLVILRQVLSPIIAKKPPAEFSPVMQR